MIKIAYILLFLAFSGHANIQNQITQTKSDIKKQTKQQKNISRKLSSIAKNIISEEKRLKNINKDILNTKRGIKEENRKTKLKRGELKTIQTLYDNLDKKEKSVGRKLTDIISKSISLEMSATHTSDILNENSIDIIVLGQMYNSYRTILKNKFSKTKKRYLKLKRNVTIVKSELDKIKNKLKDLRAKIKKYDKLKIRKKRSLKKLEIDRSAYLKKLSRIKNERATLSKTLTSLKITKIEDAQIIQPSSSVDTKVRQIGSSYQKSKLEKYRGPKTIAPLKEYTISQDFGTYTDPIYKIKIFNEAIILKSKHKNARVRNVLDGKVIYANKTTMLENVIIVQNRNNIHTIFAHLSKIAPTIKVGKKIPKGYVIGRVENELTFEVTKNEKHINPLRLIN